jgi:O-antigen/teichoic acid export membrane protein
MISKLAKAILANQNKWFTFADQALVSGVNFLLGILLARFMGVESYGVFALAWMSVLFAASLQQAFVIAPLYTLGPKQANKQAWLTGQNTIQLLISLGMIPLIFFGTTILSFFYPQWNMPLLPTILSLLVAVHLFNDYLRRVNFLNHSPKKALIMDVIGYGLQPLLIALLWNMNLLSISTALISVLLANVLSIAFALFTNRFEVSTQGLGLSLKANWDYSKFLIGTAILQWFSGNYFMLVAAAVIGPVAIGAVRIAQNIMGVLHVIFIALENIVPVKAAEALNAGGTQSMMQFFKKVSLQTAVPVFGLIGLIAWQRSLILELLYDSFLELNASLLLAFCGIYVLVYLGTQLRFIIRTVEKNQRVFLSYIITSALSLISANYIIQTFDVMGVVFGIAAVQIISIIIYIISLKSELRWTLK